MTVSSTQVRTSYTGDAASVSFATSFAFYASTDLLVVLNGVTQTLAVDYTVTGGGGALGTVVMNVAPANGINLQVVLNPPLTQVVKLVDGTAFPAATLNEEADRAVQISLRLNDKISRSLQVADGTDVNPNLTLPSIATRAGKYLAFDGSGVPTASAGTGNDSALRTDLASPATGSSLVASVKTAAETAAGVTVTDSTMPSAQGVASRYNNALTAANWRNLHAGLGRGLCIQDVDKNAGMAGNAAVDTAAFNTAAAQLGQIGEIYCPQTNLGYVINPNAITFTGPVRLRGDGSMLAGTMLTANAFATGQFMFKWNTGTASYITQAGMKGFYCKTTNLFGSVLQLTRVAEITLEDIFTEGLQDLCEATLSYSIRGVQIRTRNHRRYGFHLLGAANHVSLYDPVLDGVVAGAYGLFVEGGAAFGGAAINLYNPRFEGFTDAGSYGVVLAPVTGDIVKEFNLWGGYSEAVLGGTILSIPVDARGVRRIGVHGHRGHASGAASFITARDTQGIEIDGGYYENYGTAIMQSQGGNLQTHIHHNTLDGTPVPWSLLAGADTGGVDLHDNIGSAAGADVDGSTLSPAQITANQSDYSPTGILTFAKALRLNTDAARNITGLAGGISRREVKIFNIGAFDFTLTNEDALSTAANRFAMGASQTLNPGEGITLWYDITSARWRAYGRNT